MNNVNGVACDQYSNLVYFFNSMSGNQNDQVLYRANMEEDDDPFDEQRRIYRPSNPTYMEEIVYYVQNSTDLYGYVQDGGRNIVIARNYTNVQSMYAYQGMLFVVDQDATYVVRLDDGHYYE